jgi:threonyl-tRNA synthetase
LPIDKKNNISLKTSAAELLAYAIVTSFPEVKLVGGGATKSGFYYDAIFKDDVDNTMLVILEERLRELTQRKLPITSIEMAPASAHYYFRDKKQHVLAKKLKEYNGNIVEMVRIEDFIDKAQGPFVEHSGMIAAVKLITVTKDTNNREKITRIEGVVAYDKKALKKAAQRYKTARKNEHGNIGEKEELFEQDEQTEIWMWHKKGQKIRSTLITSLEKILEKQGFENILTTPKTQDYQTTRAEEHARLCLAERHKGKALPIRYYERFDGAYPLDPEALYGLYSLPICSIDEEHIFCEEEDLQKELISSLQFIDKIGKMLGFEGAFSCVSNKTSRRETTKQWKKYEEMLTSALESLGYSYDFCEDITSFDRGPAVIMQYKDAYGRIWEGPYVGIDVVTREKNITKNACNEKAATVMIECSFLGALERTVALLIEQHGGQQKLQALLDDIVAEASTI